jgi:hypothetical protein
MRAFKLLAVSTVIVVAAGCAAANDTTTRPSPAGTSTSTQEPPPASTPTAPVPQRQAAVYAAVLERFLSREGQTPADIMGTVYLVDRTGTSSDRGPGQPIDQAVQDQLSNLLGDHYRVTWVHSIDDASITGRLNCDRHGRRDVVISLGAVPPTGDTVKVGVDGRADCGLQGGYLYTLRNGSDGWRVTKSQGIWSA